MGIRRLILTALLVLSPVGVAMAGFSQHPNNARIATLTNSLVNSIRDAQALYYQANGRYFQGITTPGTPVDGTLDSVPNWAVRPSDQNEAWKEFAPGVFRPGFKVPFQLTMDVYESREGWGWVLRLEVWREGLGPDDRGLAGRHWVYQHHEGPQPDLWGVLGKWYVEPER